MERPGGMAETYTIECGAAMAAISTLGAEPVAWSVAGRDLLWSGDPAFWPRISPVLFPTVGRARGDEIRVGDKSYPMPIHGFAPESAFAAIKRSDDGVRLTLVDSAQTRRRYPFAFRLEVGYRLAADRLSVDFEIDNTGHEPLPFALGFHPGFRWPFADGGRDGYTIEFEAEENPLAPVITGLGLFASERRPVPLAGRRLAVSDDLFSREAICFLEAKSRSLRFVAPDGSAIVMHIENFPHLALWARPGAGFVSMEAWTGYGDPDGFAGDIFHKPSMRALAPGERSRHAVRLEYAAGDNGLDALAGVIEERT